MIDISKLVSPERLGDYPYEMGFDSSVNGADLKNCHYTLFSSQEKMKAWQEGVKDGVVHNQKEELKMRIKQVIVPVGLVELIHKMADAIKISHGGWYESYADENEIKLVEYSNQLKNRSDNPQD